MSLYVLAPLRKIFNEIIPWPALVLMLSDANGRQLGARRFQPRDYLGSAPKDALLASGQATQLAFDIVEPAPGVVAFDFRFE